MMMTVFLKSTTRPWPSVRRPSSRIWRSELKMSGCAFSISSKSTTLNGLRRTFSVSWPPSSKPTNPGGAPNSRETVCFSPYSDMSSEIIAASSSNRNSASALASSVLPTPVGPAKMNEPEGRFGSLRPARVRRIVLARAEMASSWPMTRSCSAFSMKTSRARLLFGELEDGDAGGLCEHLGDQALVDDRGGLDVARLPLLLEAQALAEQVLLLVAQRRGLLEVLLLDRGLLGGAHDGDLLVELAQLGRRREDREAQACAGLVDQVDRLVGQEAVGDVAVGEVRRGDDARRR